MIGTPVSGVLASGHDEYFQIATNPGEDLVLMANLGTASEAVFEVSANGLPDLANFDEISSNSTALSQQLVLSGNPAADYFILLAGQSAAGAGKAFSLVAQAAAFDFASVGLGQGADVGQVTVPLNGAGFLPSLSASLVGPDGTAHPAQRILVAGSTQAFATFDLVGLAPGKYDVRASQTNAIQTLHQAFTVTTGAPVSSKPGSSCRRLRAPEVPYTALVEYTNIGDTDLIAPFSLWAARLATRWSWSTANNR